MDSGGMGRTLYRDAALADGTGPDLRVGVSVLVHGDPPSDPAALWPVWLVS
jgi:hypothetical protein